MLYASALIKIAEAELGYLEKASNKDLDSKTANAGKKNYTKYARDLAKAGFYNGSKQGLAWCAVFVTWLGWKLCGEDRAKAEKLLCQTGPYGAGCTSAAQYYKQQGRFYTSNPKPGDQIFFWDAEKTRAAHTGIVVDVDDTYVYTIEGNTSSAAGVVENGGCVRNKQYKLNYARLYGYGRPKYDKESNVATSKNTTATEPAHSGPSKSKAGKYEITTNNLAIRNGAGTKKNKHGKDKHVLIRVPAGTIVQCYGYYSKVGKYTWLLVEAIIDGKTHTGFCSTSHLIKG